MGNAFFNMPPLTTARIIADYVAIKAKNLFAKAPDLSFEDWVVNRFGRRLYDIYFRVYTEKTWGIPCTRLSADWAAQRISLLSLWDTFVQTLKKAMKSSDTPRTYVSRFYYPTHGGIGAISEEYAKRMREAGGQVRLNAKVTGIEMADDRITKVSYSGGSVAVGPEDLVFSTIPITDFIGALTPSPPKDVLEASGSLKFRSIVLVHLMFGRDGISPDHWIYLPELKYLANRVSESRNFSAGNAPEGKTIIGAEITCQLGDETWKADKETLAKRVLDDLADIGLVKKGEYLGSRIHYMPHAYPIYDLEYRPNLDKAIGHLKGVKNLRFFGRNGLFRYNNMDHSISMGQTAAKSVTDKNTDYLKVATEGHWFG
ncbi:MAG: FAD-dependent oxidoreductase [Candidatus Altiarchaeota archaeon]